VSDRPTIKQGDKSDAVARWQSIVGVKADGSFGPLTHAKTVEWQRVRGLTPDGVVGPKTWAAALDYATAVASVPVAPAAPPAAASGPVVELPARRTPASVPEVYAALGRCWRAKFNEEPKKTSLCVLLAQWALETGKGKAMWCFNLGNIKGKSGGSDGRCWTYFACNEILPIATAHAMVSKAGLRETGTGEKDAVITATKDGMATVWFYPNHYACCFRAYRTLDEGAADYLDMLHRRFASAWPAVVAGDPSQFSKLLKAARYYTADEAHYTRGVVSIYLEMLKQVG